MSGTVSRLCLIVAMAVWTGEARAVVLDPPTLHCASVNVAGDVTLTWTIPADPGGDFGHYEIWQANNPAGPFNLVTMIFVAGQVTTFPPIAAGANAGPQYFYMTTVTNGLPPETSVPSDTVATLFLQVFQSTPLGSANLAWNAPAMAATAAPLFTIWMEYPIGTWTQIATVDTNTFVYQHVISICEDSLTFRIGLADPLGCVSFSNLDGAIFSDATPPSVPVLTAVTVDTLSGLSSVSWGPSPEPDTDGYIIVWIGPGGGVIIDTIFGQNNTSYTWPDSYPAGGTESFVVAAFDTCETGTPPSPNTSATGVPHTTMFAYTTYDRCGAQVRIWWTPYVGWPVQNYQVLVQANGGSWSVLANAGPDESSIFHDVQPGITYCYVVKAVQGPGLPSSLSNKACRFSDYPPSPQFNYLRTVTVTAPDIITLVDSVDMSAHVSEYYILRSDNGGAFNTVATLTGGGGPVITWNDTDVDPASVGYRYQVQVTDSCGQVAVTSNIGANIVLRATGDLTGVNRLDWNGYVQWAGAVSGYTLYRSVGDDPTVPLATLPPDPWVYVDDVQSYTASSGRFCYYVQAIEAGNTSGINATSESNVACAVQEELVYIPNAFIVGSAYNSLFFPVMSYVDFAEYELSIINRWGQVIWTTHDPGEAWTGTVGSNTVPVGVYGYYCAFENGAGKRFEKRGTVTVLTAKED
ncbi:MAG: gliding motility-associated C-terminal domain-containing protein [Flavobacteriales bacterium]